MSNLEGQPTRLIRVRGKVSEKRAARIKRRLTDEGDPLAPARGCITGALLALTMYVLLALIVVIIYLGVNQ